MKIFGAIYKYVSESLWAIPVLIICGWIMFRGGHDGGYMLLISAGYILLYSILRAVHNSNLSEKTAHWIAGIATVIITTTVLFFAWKTTSRNGEDYFNDPKTTIVFEQTEVNVGDIVLGATVDCVYKFRNIGKNPLIIYYVDAGCACTGYRLSDTRIPPGGVGEITLALDTKDKSAGEFLVNATVRVNTEDKVYPLVIEGNVID